MWLKHLLGEKLLNIVDKGYSFDDLMLVPRHGVLVSRKDADISTLLFPNGGAMLIPIVSANMKSVTEHKMAHEIRRLGGYGFNHRIDKLENRLMEFQKSGGSVPSLGLKDTKDDINKFIALGSLAFLLDLAHADSERAIHFVKWFKNEYPGIQLAVGNVATVGGVYRLAEVGADCIKIGIGPGAACITREVTGFGVPQLTAINNAEYVRDRYPNFRFTIIADGGIRNSGDIVKALAAGADSVMIGRLFAGCDEAPEPGSYRGNASKSINGHNAPEGIEGEVPKSGPLEEVVKNLTWGIRSGVSYAGARNLKQLRENAQWIEVTSLSHNNETKARI